MLVLSRRLNDKIVIPSRGITIEVVGIKGNTVKLGVSAPRDVKVLRSEIAADKPAEVQPSPTHTLCNQLNNVGLSLQLFEKQWRAGLAPEAGATLSRVYDTLEKMDRDWVAEHAFTANAPLPRPGARLRALVVEDDHNERELLAGLLNLNGCECHTAGDGLEALDYLAAHDRPDLVLLDWVMPRCDGRQTLARIRGDHRLQGLKVFAVSGARPDEAGPGGVDAWFPKPLNTRKLWDAIRTEFATAIRAD